MVMLDKGVERGQLNMAAIMFSAEPILTNSDPGSN